VRAAFKRNPRATVGRYRLDAATRGGFEALDPKLLELEVDARAAL